jgi:hypothetical protein
MRNSKKSCDNYVAMVALYLHELGAACGHGGEIKRIRNKLKIC